MVDVGKDVLSRSKKEKGGSREGEHRAWRLGAGVFASAVGDLDPAARPLRR